MYRIDENTYIDDSPVTCAEYQLFIDEMLEQGKHFQPDHWTTYQFPSGQAFNPIVGVRPSDARAFCKWLTQREAKEWRYRLPAYNEAMEHPLQFINLPPLGYWTGNDNNTQFAWAGPIPANLIDFNLASPLNLDFTIARAFDIDLTSDRDLDLDSASARAFNIASDRTLDLTRTLTSLRALDLTRALTSDRAPDLASISSLELADLHALDRASNRALALTRALLDDLDRALALASNRILNRAFANTRGFIQAIYNDLTILQARIIWRSPTFEGIRIVKERK